MTGAWSASSIGGGLETDPPTFGQAPHLRRVQPENPVEDALIVLTQKGWSEDWEASPFAIGNR